MDEYTATSNKATATTHKATNQLSRSQSREVLLLLFLCSELINRVHNERRLNGSCGSVTRVYPMSFDQ